VSLGTNIILGSLGVRTSGWSRTDIDSEISIKKLWMSQNTTDLEACAEALPNNVQHLLSDSNICAINETPESIGK
jgi:hypothetical protein